MDATGRSTILLVDDEPDILTGMQALLESSLDDVEVLTATSGDEALAVMRRRHVDVILSDLRMPGMNGLQLLHEAITVSPGSRRILLTAYDVDPQAVGPAGVELSLRKPVDPPAVVDHIRRALVHV